ncbi:MAG: SCO1664 family protein [Chloroflexi bacterium]|nr:SCO1664 family protein [Chloroflexota bacterium]
MDRDALELLHSGALTLDGRLIDSTNNAFVGVVRLGSREARCVYKPVAGERPLRDFPDGTLAHREVAAYRLSEALPWPVVPPTVLRAEGPFGAGMAQLWIEVDAAADVEQLMIRGDERVRRIALFDAIVNNTDRKGGHLLLTGSGRLYGVDHGVTFSAHPKLRTILWGWRGRPFTAEERAVLATVRDQLAGALGEDLRALLHPLEVDATASRVESLLSSGVFPSPAPGWPAVPWPQW